MSKNIEPAISTKDKLGEYDAIETAKTDEILFPIQGGDPFGPKTVLYWVELCRAAGMREENSEKATHLLRKATNAEIVAWAMMAYQRQEVDPIAKRAQYNDVALAAKADATQTTRSTLIQITRILHNTIAQINDAADSLEVLKMHDIDCLDLRFMVASLNEIVGTIEPRRGNERT